MKSKKQPSEETLNQCIRSLPSEVASTFDTFCKTYKNALDPQSYHEALPVLLSYVQQLTLQLSSPYTFSHFHERELAPFDFFHMAREFIKPLVDMEHSSIHGKERLLLMEQALERKENIIFLANHQTEPDPQIISLMVEPYSPHIANEMVYVAGHRVTTDPLAVPLSRGCNLICIYSKKYIEHEPERKAEKLLHNSRSLNKIDELLNRGGTALFVAPSGGRDRWNETGDEVLISPFDPQSVELFRLLAKKASRPTHIHLLTLSTINILPPPKAIQVTLGEQRVASKSPVHLDFSEEVLFDEPLLSTNKIEMRKERAELLTNKIKSAYSNFFRA